MMKPPSWIGLRPRVSTVATVTQYPGTAPARTMIRLPIAVLYRISLPLVSKAIQGSNKSQTLVQVAESSDLLSGRSMRGRVANSGEDSCVVQRKAVVGNIQEEPGEGTAMES